MDQDNQINLQEARFEKIIEKAFKKEIGLFLFYEELLKAKLYYIASVPSDYDYINHEKNKNCKYSLVVYNDMYGEPCIPIFSSLKQLEKLQRKDVVVYYRESKEIFKIFVKGRYILNLASECGKVLLPEEIEALLDGRILTKSSEIHIEPGEPLAFIQPKKFPKKFTIILSKIMRNNPEIQNAYLAYVIDSNAKNGFRVMIAIDASCHINKITPNLINALKTYNLISEDIDIIDFTSYNDLSGSVLTYFQSLKPFYYKKNNSEEISNNI